VLRSDRGFRPTGSYSISNIESVNETSGGVSLKIPLAQTPPGRNGHRYGLSLHYNSAFYDLDLNGSGNVEIADEGAYPPTSYPNLQYNSLYPRDGGTTSGGWRYSHRIYLDSESRTDCNTSQPYCFRLSLVLGDGSTHALRMRVPEESLNDPQGSGFSQINYLGRRGFAPTNTAYGANHTFYSTDGSYIRVETSAVSDGASPPVYSGSWRAYFPDGRSVSGPIAGFVREADQICEKDGQCISIANSYNINSQLVHTELREPIGRRISITYNPATLEDEIRVLASGASTAELDPRLNSNALTTRVKWRTVSFGDNKPTSNPPVGPWYGIFYKCRPSIWDGASEGGLPVCMTKMSLNVVERVTLPVGSPGLFYEFLYADSSARALGAQVSRGEIREIRLPNRSGETAAKVEYLWKQSEIDALGSPWSPVHWFEAGENPVVSKKVTYFEQDGSNSVLKTQQWNYSFGPSSSEITGPTGQKTKHYYTSKGLLTNWERGLIHKSVSIPSGG
jgi:hypothetical protein